MGVMDNDAFENYLQDIESYVIEENKVVTYKWLSKYLNIHVNTAKQLLYSFAEQQGNKVHSTYLVSGQLKNNKGDSVQIVREKDLGRIKDGFKFVTSEHVYSVQKAKELKDLNMLYAVDVYNRSETYDVKRLGSITCKSSVLRSEESVAALKQKSQSASVVGCDKQWPTGKQQFSSGAGTKNGVSTTKQEKEAGESKESTGTKEENDVKIKAKKGGIAAMFAAQNTKNKKQEENEPKTKKDTEGKSQKSENGISAFFSRQVTKQSSLPSKKSDGEKNSQATSNEMESESVTSSKNSKEIKEKSKDAEVKKGTVPKGDRKSERKSKKNEGGSKKGRKGDKSPPAKKRKRIVVMSDSEESNDDDELANEEEDERMCCSPPPQPKLPDSDDDIIAPTPDAGLKKGRRRIRKLVDKTYMDEDGYMLTCKEYVTESCSGSEPEDKEKENKSRENSEKVETNSPKDKEKQVLSKEKTSPQKTKQASIMNFFKKK